MHSGLSTGWCTQQKLHTNTKPQVISRLRFSFFNFLLCASQSKYNDASSRLSGLESLDKELRRQLSEQQHDISSLRQRLSAAEVVAAEAAGLRQALSSAENQLTGAVDEMATLQRTVAELQGQKDAAQVSNQVHSH